MRGVSPGFRAVGVCGSIQGKHPGEVMHPVSASTQAYYTAAHTHVVHYCDTLDSRLVYKSRHPNA